MALRSRENATRSPNGDAHSRRKNGETLRLSANRVASSKGHAKVIPFSSPEERFIDFLVDQAVSAWRKTISED
jgi:hypothetical protein